MENQDLSEDEKSIWESLVAEGRKVRAPILERKAKEREANRRRMAEDHGRDPDESAGWRSKGRVPAEDAPVPVGVKRFVVCRAAGMSFAQAAAESGCRWSDITLARNASEEVRCAVEGMEGSSRFLMRMKAMSIMEQSQEEGARVSHAQVLMAESILKRLDHSHFGDAVAKVVGEADEGVKAVGGGGFVINVIADAAKVAGEVPKERPAKALVYTDV